MHSIDLRQRLAELETAVERSAAAVTDATTVHAAAIRHAVETGDHTSAEQAEAMLHATRSTHIRSLVMAEEARSQLAAAIHAERAEFKATARIEITTELAALAVDAADIDASFAILVDRVMALRAREISLRNRTRQTHREASGGPEHLSALRSLASHLNAAASCLSPDAPTSVARAVAAGSRAIKVALDE